MSEKVSLTLSIMNYGWWRYGLSITAKDRRIEKIFADLGLYVNQYGSYERKHNFERVMKLIGKTTADYGLDDIMTSWWHEVEFKDVERLLEVKDEIMEDIVTYLSKVVSIVSNQRTKRVVELIPESSRPSTLPKRKLSRRVFMQVGDSVYEVELKKVRDIESIDELPDLIREKLREEVELEYAAIIYNLKQEVKELRDRLVAARAEAVRESWRYFNSLFKMGWQVGEEGKFIYPGRIHAKYVKVQTDDKLITYMIPEEHRKFYVEGVIFDPQWNEVRVEKAFNPHVDGNVCTGDYQFSLESLDRVFEMFETIYLNSMFSNKAAEEITKLYREGKLVKVKEEVVAYVE